MLTLSKPDWESVSGESIPRPILRTRHGKARSCSTFGAANGRPQSVHIYLGDPAMGPVKVDWDFVATFPAAGELLGHVQGLPSPTVSVRSYAAPPQLVIVFC
jgi:hypothetical protein